MHAPILCPTCTHEKVCQHVHEYRDIHATMSMVCEKNNPMFSVRVQCLYFESERPILRGIGAKVNPE